MTTQIDDNNIQQYTPLSSTRPLTTSDLRNSPKYFRDEVRIKASDTQSSKSRVSAHQSSTHEKRVLPKTKLSLSEGVSLKKKK